MIGYNLVTVTAVCDDGEEITTDIFIMNFNEENMEAADVDLSDTDGDGIDNYSEFVLGLNPYLEDSDGDKLKDLEEMAQVGTSPIMIDTDENGVNDGEEDADEDGLCNLAEIQHGTEVLYEDSDGDRLDDGEELLKYMTDPLVADSDEDGLSDGEDVLMGFEPLNPDTDGNGILDGDEVVYQTCIEELDQERAAGITQVFVSMDCAGYIDNEVSIFNVYNLDMRTTDVVGLVGAPVEIETEQEFDEATLVFTYDESTLGETAEDNLRIMWYDEENDEYELLDEETVIDKENNTLSCKTTHFSTWLVVDVLKWLKAMSVDLGYDELDATKSCTFDYVIAMDWGAFDPTLAYSLPAKKYAYWFEFGRKPWYYGQNEYVARDTIFGGSNKGYLVGTHSEMLNTTIDMLENLDNQSPNRRVYFFSVVDLDYNAEFVRRAKEEGISVCFITSASGVNVNLKRMAAETNGECITISRWRDSADVRIPVLDNVKKTIEMLENFGNSVDTDKDGLPDVYEENGMLLSDGTIVYSDPGLVDSDKDGINDFVEVGGLPEKVTYSIFGEEYTFLVFKGALYEKLSSEFIFVDGTPNRDGTVNDEKMNYVPYLNSNKELWYEEKKDYTFLSEYKEYYGVAGLYNKFAHKKDDVSVGQTFVYSVFNTSVLYALIEMDLWMAYDCYALYVSTWGGADPGIENRGTRKYVNVDNILKININNSANENFQDNMCEVIKVAESVLNEYNTEVYFSVASHAGWDGCFYHDTNGFLNMEYNIAALANMNAFGTFNKANAAATIHCTYEPETKKYKMEYNYYLTDFYDVTWAPACKEQEAIGDCRSYELYGKGVGNVSWNKGQKTFLFYPHSIVS